MLNNINRIGNFTSSKIVALTSWGSRPMTEEELIEYKKENPKSQKKTIKCWPGEAALTYIEERNMERRLGCSLETESNARSLSWGSLCEKVADEMNGISYTFCSNQTQVHPEISCWSGSPDYLNEDTVGDYKCPTSRKSFIQLVQPLYDGLTGLAAMNKVRETHPEGETYYWQLVSNAIIFNKRYAELSPFMPYKSQLPDIQMLADGIPNCYWIANALAEELPYLPDGGYYKNFNKIRFEVPEEDKIYLIALVIQSSERLIPPFASGAVSDPFIASYDPEVKSIIIE